MSLPEDVPLEDVTGLRKRQALALGARVRVRQCAVVGAALVAAWAGGSGIASATEGEGQLPICDEITAAGVDGGEPTCLPIDEEPGCEAPPLTLQSESDPVSEEPCGPFVDADFYGDCENPENLTFYLDAFGLEPGDYTVSYSSSGFSLPAGSQGNAVFSFAFDVDQSLVVEKEFDDIEGDVLVSDDGFVVDWAVVDSEGQDVASDSFEVAPCEEVPVDTTPGTQPAIPVAPITTPVAAPVVVTPVAAHPAVLANTGSPVTTAALLGGGLLVAGTGALVATRRRAS